MHDYLNNKLPECFKDNFFRLNDPGGRCTRNSSLSYLIIPSKGTTNYGIKSISQQSIYDWNDQNTQKKSDLFFKMCS